MLKNYINENIIDAINALEINVYQLEILTPLSEVKNTIVRYFGFNEKSVFDEYTKLNSSNSVNKIYKIDKFTHRDSKNKVTPISEDYENFENNYLIYDGLCWDKTKEVALKVRDIFINEFSKKSA